jgi:excisionase family DNA binding protein
VSVITDVPVRSTVPALIDAGRETYTVAEVSEMLSLALRTTYSLVRAGEIPALKMGARWVVPKRRFHAWLDGHDGALAAEPEPRPVAADLARERIASARFDAAMTRRQFAHALGELLDRPVTVAQVERWETDTIPPGDVLMAAGMVSSNGRNN